jgi:hypothetical protein
MALLLVPILGVALTWLAWETYCTYDVIRPIGTLPDGFHGRHDCDPGNCPYASAELRCNYSEHRHLRMMAGGLVLGLLVMGVLLSESLG